mgnify:CR=1 FL=1
MKRKLRDLPPALLMLVRQLNEGRAEIENQFTRSVTPLGNQKAQALMAEVFELLNTLIEQARHLLTDLRVPRD